MIIVDKESKYRKNFRGLREGDVFKTQREGAPFIKMRMCGGFNCVGLLDGIPSYIRAATDVTPFLDAEVHLYAPSNS